MVCSPLFTYIWVIFRANVGKYSSIMELQVRALAMTQERRKELGELFGHPSYSSYQTLSANQPSDFYPFLLADMIC